MGKIALRALLPPKNASLQSRYGLRKEPPLFGRREVLLFSDPSKRQKRGSPLCFTKSRCSLIISVHLFPGKGTAMFEKFSAFVKKNTLCGSTIAPACEYCERCRPATDPRMLLCPQKGLVAPYYSCSKFLYDPLRRVPRRQPKLPTFSPEDFSLD